MYIQCRYETETNGLLGFDGWPETVDDGLLILPALCGAASTEHGQRMNDGIAEARAWP